MSRHPRHSRSQRPAVRYLGVEIGGTKLQVGIGNPAGRVEQLVAQPVVRRRGRDGILAQLREMLPPLIASSRPRAMGVGFGGPVDLLRGCVVRSFQVRGWEDFALRDWLRELSGLPVAFENDSNCAALAEARWGAGRGLRRVLYCNVGTGIGGGFVVNGVVQNGCCGASEIGHLQVRANGRWRTLESVASGLALERGTTTLAQVGREVGAALANAVTLLNPERVIVGGGVAQAGERFWRPLRQTARRLVFSPFRPHLEIVPAAFGQAVVVVGAITLAAQRSADTGRGS